MALKSRHKYIASSDKPGPPAGPTDQGGRYPAKESLTPPMEGVQQSKPSHSASNHSIA